MSWSTGSRAPHTEVRCYLEARRASGVNARKLHFVGISDRGQEGAGSERQEWKGVAARLRLGEKQPQGQAGESHWDLAKSLTLLLRMDRRVPEQGLGADGKPRTRWGVQQFTE